jgi:hypothetical protein
VIDKVNSPDVARFLTLVNEAYVREAGVYALRDALSTLGSPTSNGPLYPRMDSSMNALSRRMVAAGGEFERGMADVVARHGLVQRKDAAQAAADALVQMFAMIFKAVV